MNALTVQQRKFVYLGGILLLLIPIISLGMPPSDKDGQNGGSIARMRQELDLGESDLGELDPASSAMNLVLLGLRGVAANILWMQAEDAKLHKDFPQLRVTTDSIVRLQPHYVKVWEYNSWNLSYNVSAEWDAVPDRYFWVKEGAKFLQRGVQRNRKAPDLYWTVGRVYGHKIGMSDEAKYFRRYFKADPDPKFKGGPDFDFNKGGEDNYLVAKGWFQQANDVEATGQVRQRIMDRSIFRSYPARSQLDYASALYKYGFNEEFDAEAGDRNLSAAEQDALQLRVREKLRDITRSAWEIGLDDWTKKYGQELITLEYLPGVVVSIRLEMSNDEIHEMAKSPEEENLLKRAVDQYQKMNNYRYWRTRALSEAETDTAEAHWLLFAADQQYWKQEAPMARQLAEQSMALFAKTVEKFPDLKSEDNFIEEILTLMLVWQNSLQFLGEPVPETYPLKDIWDEHQGALPEVRTRFERRSWRQ